MSRPQVQNDPIVNLPNLYVNGLVISNDAITPTSKLNISAGICRDSNNIMDLNVGFPNANLEGNIVAAPLSVSTLLLGAGGLDTGVLASFTIYYIYLIGDSRYYKPVAAIMSASSTQPLLPFGYDSFRLIGFTFTDNTSPTPLLYIGYNSGTSNSRTFTYDAPRVVLNTNTTTSYVLQGVVNSVPLVDNTKMIMQILFTTVAANNFFYIKGGRQVSDQWVLNSYVAGATAATTLVVPDVLAQVNGVNFGFEYKSTVAAPVIGSIIAFDYSI